MTSPNYMSKRRSNIEILKSLKEFVENKKREGVQEFFKSELRSSKDKVFPKTAFSFFQIIEKAQTEFPRIKVREVGGSTLISILNDSETFVELIDKLIADVRLSKETSAELITLRTKLQSGEIDDQK